MSWNIVGFRWDLILWTVKCCKGRDLQNMVFVVTGELGPNAASDMINAGNSVVCWADQTWHTLLSNTAVNKGNEQERYNLVCIFAKDVKVNPSQAASLYIQ